MGIDELRKTLEELAAQAGFTIVDRLDLPGQEPRYAPPPSCLGEPLRARLAREYPNGLYEHQVRAIEASLVRGEDICLATSTASGKSLVFMTVAQEVLRQNPTARILALYPARALIQDQKEKWEAALTGTDEAVGHIDGGIPVSERSGILRSCRVVLMTPDVGHAWLLSHLEDRTVRAFLMALRILVLDEAHVYEGVFGTNMAYFLRRLQSAAGRHQLIAATATVDAPDEFIRQLTGRAVRCFGPDEDGAARTPKTVLLAQHTGERPFDSTVALLQGLTRAGIGRFLAFADSRRAVEQIVAVSRRNARPQASDAEEEDDDSLEDTTAVVEEWLGHSTGALLMPYRAGYETADREMIQTALRKGQLSGVVATSALELGLDIGEIDIAVMLNLPPSMKAFWQRVGRAGRRNPAICLLLDDRANFRDLFRSLAAYIKRPLEPNWIYLDNRYIQYTNALCAADEVAKLGSNEAGLQPFASLPERFISLLRNELSPTEVVPPELYVLKQRAQTSPHYEFPLRSASDKEFQVKERYGRELGRLSFPQVLREAYPGAIYYYMARPYRVTYIKYRDGEIFCKREKTGTTQPIIQAKVFPRFPTGVHQLLRAGQGFVAEAEMQVSERVLGFTQQFGSNKQNHMYGVESPYSQKPLIRFFETTGVCWYFPEQRVVTEAVAEWLREAFCVEFGVQPRDLGVGTFLAQQSPLDGDRCSGVCIFDATNGSLRLTERLAQDFPRVVDAAVAMISGQGRPEDIQVAQALPTLRDLIVDLTLVQASDRLVADDSGEEQWEVIIAPGEPAMLLSSAGGEQVTIRGYRYTPQGLRYDLETPPGAPKRNVPATALQPLYGETRMLRVNLMTGEEVEVS